MQDALPLACELELRAPSARSLKLEEAVLLEDEPPSRQLTDLMAELLPRPLQRLASD